MERYVQASDGIPLHFQVSGDGAIALVFVHGWLGNAGWWDAQKEFFQGKYTVVQVDLPGRGKSGKGRAAWSSYQYASDIKAVAAQLDSKDLVLVGHSMSGPYVLEASLMIPLVRLVVLVDTVKDLEKVMSFEQANEMIFSSYRKDFSTAVRGYLPQFLYSNSTPVHVRERLQSEFLDTDVDFAISSLEPLYRMDLHAIAEQVSVPVRAINSDYTPTNKDSIRKYIRDFDFVSIHGTGHYPMLEDPETFNLALDRILQEQNLQQSK